MMLKNSAVHLYASDQGLILIFLWQTTVYELMFTPSHILSLSILLSLTLMTPLQQHREFQTSSL